ncbi:hypothetical protein NDU88_002844 [Pleurodeles waltl]|uniref:Uncharacterized protein n=1 Tax=Pleurodeles waltl TaxID=8319 RepID=A0AAV7LDL4_PLEWA|nr:hypothetical protein NDU88_002844 [Pleurodeles waltl]
MPPQVVQSSFCARRGPRLHSSSCVPAAPGPARPPPPTERGPAGAPASRPDPPKGAHPRTQCTPRGPRALLPPAATRAGSPQRAGAPPLCFPGSGQRISGETRPLTPPS